MIRTLRGAWSRRGTLLPLLLLTLVVTAGAVCVLGFAGAAGTSPMLAVPLLLLGAIAVPATGRELAIARRREVALARLRGLEGGSLWTLLAVEPLLVLLVGGALGIGLGAVGSRLTSDLWVEAPASGVGPGAVLAGLAIVAVGLVVVLAGMAGALREPLADQVSIASRPRAASTTATFLNVLLLVAAVVAVYRSSAGAGGDPDWVVLAGPALVGLAVGQVVVWLVRILARVGVGRTTNRSLPAFLAVRRLARVADAATALRVLVAAAVVAALAITGATQVDEWTADTARLRAGAPLVVDLDGDAMSALSLTRDLDPDGRWLMAAVLVPGQGSLPARRAFLDTARYDAVVGDFLSGTPAAGVSRSIADLGGGDPGIATGNTASITVRGVSSRVSGAIRPRIAVAYRNPAGLTDTVVFRMDVGLDGAETTATRPLENCSAGCVVTGLTMSGSTDAQRPWILSGLDFGGIDALAGDWRAVPTTPPAGVRPVAVISSAEGLLFPATDATLQTFPVTTGPVLPVLATDTVDWAGAPPQVDSPGGDERQAQILGTLPALPLVEADGLLADLPRAAAGAPPTVPAAEVMVLARSDTPPDVLTKLVAAAGHGIRTVADVRSTTANQTGAVQARVYTLLAGFCLLVALLVLGASVARQRSAWLLDVAALRVLGVRPSQLRRAGLTEVFVLTLVGVAATAAGSVVAVRLLLAHLDLVAVPEHAIPLQTYVAVLPIAVAAGAVAAVVVLVSGRGRGIQLARSAPAILREEAAP
ncbi:FtsX-like permease family protein [Nocardioides sp.]|uniref:FtsX-like permease family protein n=1 Tax=Nocardioides sp. TaxID=35761 RepID=UPI0031FEADFA|nr:FtsX-like permease family protein [Nocardioides sp.]